ncbi:STAS domain-containing protein [Guyparkeria hydrothermalis]|uniref:STAS domain-containing protein n=1 Tax=Guyparkeria hydrothermalis TaxID=923 RepID=UPI00202276B6|nr:STAS domain-containing protein [Guyparkeria hydrothermalis]MCL7744043.1 STAS domain-containing protein [Guyparkeria hydrothermalis]
MKAEGTEPDSGWDWRVEPGLLRVRGALVRSTLDRRRPGLPAEVVGPEVEIHLGQLRRIDTAGLAWLAAVQADAEEKGIRLRYTHAPQAMRQMMGVYGLDELMTLETGLD